MEDPLPDTPVRFVLKAPYAVGTQWQAATTAFPLMRRSHFLGEISHTQKNISMQYEIEALNEALDNPVGRSDKCLRVKGSADARVHVDPALGWRDLPLTTLEWYCLDVGLERREPVASPFLTGGTVTMELAAWQ